MPGLSPAWRRQLAPQAAQLVSSQREFELDTKPECARVGVGRETVQIGRVVLDPANRIEARRIIAKAVTGISGKLRLDAQLQPVGEPVFELVNGGLAVAEHKIVLELELMRLDYRAADLEVLGFGLKSRGGNDDARG